jgi:hypothetical protein
MKAKIKRSRLTPHKTARRRNLVIAPVDGLGVIGLGVIGLVVMA